MHKVAMFKGPVWHLVSSKGVIVDCNQLNTLRLTFSYGGP